MSSKPQTKRRMAREQKNLAAWIGSNAVWHDPRRQTQISAEFELFAQSEPGHSIAEKAALGECWRGIAEDFYALGLSYFASSVGRNQNVYVRGSLKPPRTVLENLKNLADAAHGFGGNDHDGRRFLHIARNPFRVSSLRSRSRQWCEAAVAVSGGRHVQAMELLAAHLMLEGRSAAALLLYNRIAFTTDSQRLRAFSLSNAGKALLDLGCPRAAASACEQAISIFPGDPIAHSNLAISKLLIFDFAGALATYERICDLGRKERADDSRVRGLIDSDLRWVEKRNAIPAQQVKKIRKELQVMGLADR